MADPTPTAQVKVEEAIAAAITAYGPLVGWDVLTDVPLAVSLSDRLGSDDITAIVVRTMGLPFGDVFEPGGSFLMGSTIDVAAVVKEAGISNSRRAQEGLAHCQAALLADYTLGGRLQDLLPIDQAPGDGTNRDADEVSTQFRAEYLTSRTDPFTILGHAGATF